MYSETYKTKSLCIFLLFIILSLGVVFYQNKSIEEGKSTLAESLFSSITMPVKRTVNNLATGISSFLSSFRPSEELIKENKKLKNQVNELKKENETLKEALEENKRLKKLLEFRNELDIAPLTTAQIVGREPDSWFQAVTIGKGSKNEITKNMVVLNNEGLIGRVMVVSPYSSKVMLITDGGSYVPALVRENRVSGIVYGTGNRCEMKYISIEAEIKTGDTVVTSGLGQIFPRGIVIGTVDKVYPSPNKLFQRAEIEPSVQFESLEDVIIIVKSNPEEEINLPAEEGK